MSSQEETDSKNETESGSGSGSGATSGVQRVQVLAGTTGDTEALEELLSSHYSVITSTTLQDADCYLIDDQSLPTYRDGLVEMKTEADPTFCPILLMHREDTRIHVTLPEMSGEVDGVRPVDDVIDAPVTQEGLVRRIENLLVRRARSLELTREFERAEQWFQSLFSALPDPAFVLDTDGRIRAVNDAFCTLVGEDRPELISERLSSVPTSGVIFDDIQTSVRTDELSRIGATNSLVELTSRENTRPESAQLSIQTATVDGDRYIVGILSDVTELIRKTERLEELASVLSHDLRNPIQVAELNLQALQDSLSAGKAEVDAIERAIDRIEDLTEKLVSVARTGEDALDQEPVRARSCAKQAWDGIATETAELVIEGETTPLFRADRVRFEQLLGNLFRNALDHAGENVTVWFGWENNMFYVEDDGPGIPENEREKVFEMGYSNHPGGGLGLAIVSEVAQAHGWEVRVTDGRESGARFEFSNLE